MYAAIDIGGTKTLVAVFDSKGKVKEEIKFPTPEDYGEFIKELATTVDNLSTKDFRAAGVAAPGRIDRKNGVGIAFGNLPWQNVPIEADTEKILSCPVFLENDAKLAALSEAQYVKKDYKKVLYITVSTGIGTGLIINGKIDADFEDMEAGQIWIQHGDKLDRWEHFASGRAIVKRFGKKASEITDPKTWDIIAYDLEVGMLALIASLTPEIIIIGGGVGAHFDKFKGRLIAKLKEHELPLVPMPPVVQAVHPEKAVIYGCYEIARQHYEHIT